MGRSLVVRDMTSGTIVAAQVEIGSSFRARLRGLMGRGELPPGHGLWLPGTGSIHMLFMRFAIDAVFLSKPDADGARTALAVRHALAPWRGVVWHVAGADGVVELAAGSLRGSLTSVGHRIAFDDDGGGTGGRDVGAAE